MMNQESLGPAERIVQTILAYSDHMVHNRPGMVVKDASAVIGMRWSPVTHQVEGDQKIVFQLAKQGKKTNKARVGVITEVNQTKNDAGVVIGEYRPAGIFPEVAAWMYRQVAEVWRLDNEFAARWASHAFAQEHRDMKVALAALKLVQARRGDPVVDGGKVAASSTRTSRDVGEAMMLVLRKDGKDLQPQAGCPPASTTCSRCRPSRRRTASSASATRAAGPSSAAGRRPWRSGSATARRTPGCSRAS